MVRYPFTPESRQFFERLSIEEIFSSNEIQGQAESRLLSCLGRGRYEPHISELIDFTSFFVVALVASQDSYLAQRFAKKEGERARKLFAGEKPVDKASVFGKCTGLRLDQIDSNYYGYRVRVEGYLQFVTRLELTKLGKWQLVNQALSEGVVYFTENRLNDLFGDASEQIIKEGVANLKRTPFPRQLMALRDKILPYLPPQRIRTARGYLYIEDLIKHPVADGRHRLTWLVLAPYLVNVKKLGESEAVEIIQSFVAGVGETRPMKRFIEYNVRRSKRNGLLPPTLRTLRSQHPDLYSLIPSEILEKFQVAR
jgi:hypothetical protein